MNDEQIVICAVLCGLAAFAGYKLAQHQAGTTQAQAQAAAPMDNMGWLLAGGWSV